MRLICRRDAEGRERRRIARTDIAERQQVEEAAAPSLAASQAQADPTPGPSAAFFVKFPFLINVC
ncbi:MAG: hypothetical protein WCD80_15365 [Desulfobaccales bacterium]